MNKNTLTAILMGFVICLGIVVIVLSIKLSIRPKAEEEPDLSAPANVFVDNTEPTETPATPEPTPESTPTPEPETVTVQMVRTTVTVNVRADSTTDSDKLGSAVKGSEFVMIEKLDNGWTKIEYEGAEAYIKSDYLEAFEKEVEATPVPDPGTEGAEGTGGAGEAGAEGQGTGGEAPTPTPAAP